MLKTVFNFTLRLSQICELYCSLVHLHTSIYRTLAFFPSEAANTSSDDAITTLDAARAPQMSRPYFSLRSLSRYISINIFDVLCVISRVQSDVFPTVHDLHDLDLSLGILRQPSIYYPLGTYCSIHSYPLVHMEHVHPTHSFFILTVS